jgi:hypothetical protein
MAEAKVIISADASKHVSEMGRAGKSVKDYGDKWKGVKDMAIGQMLGNIATKAAQMALSGAKGAFEFATQLRDLNQQTGLSVTELQSLIYAGEDMGIEMGNTTAVIQKLLAEFDNMKKTGEISKDFLAMGFTVEDMGNISDDAASQIEAFSKKLKAVEGDSQKTAAGMAILGTKTRRTADIFKQLGESGFTGMADKFGGKMLTSGEVERADVLEQKGRDLRRTAEAKIIGIGGIGTGDTTKAIDADLAARRAKAAQLSLKDPVEEKRKEEERKRNEKIEGVQTDAAKSIEELNAKSLGGGGATAADQLASIGGALGGGQSTWEARMADRQVAVAEATKKITEKMAEDIAKIAKEGGGYE